MSFVTDLASNIARERGCVCCVFQGVDVGGCVSVWVYVCMLCVSMCVCFIVGVCGCGCIVCASVCGYVGVDVGVLCASVCGCCTCSALACIVCVQV